MKKYRFDPEPPALRLTPGGFFCARFRASSHGRYILLIGVVAYHAGWGRPCLFRHHAGAGHIAVPVEDPCRGRMITHEPSIQVVGFFCFRSLRRGVPGMKIHGDRPKTARPLHWWLLRVAYAVV